MIDKKSSTDHAINPMQHPRLNDAGQPVYIAKPGIASAHASWDDASMMATATPDCNLPKTIAGLSCAAWMDAPATNAGWQALSGNATFFEPPMPKVAGKKPAAGVVVMESDGRVWVVCPTNAFGGYTATFPKGKLDGLSPHVTAVKEAFEESGLRVELTGYLCDSVRSTSVTRYYLARRLGGSPAAMGWESQAVMLVPAAELAATVSHKNDQAIVQAVLQYL